MPNFIKNRLILDFNHFNINHFFQLFIFIFPFLLVAIFTYFLYYSDYSTFNKLMRRENHPVELITFLFLLAGAITGFIFSYKLAKSGEKLVSIFYFIFAFGLLFVAMEEISWGQWIFKFHTPDYMRGLNRQTEFNVHNIESVNLSFEILRVIFGLGGIVSIFLLKFKTFKFLSSPLSLISWFVIILIFASLDFYNRFDTSYQAFYKGNIFWFTRKFTEFLEMLISISAFLFIWLNYKKISFKVVGYK